MNKEQFLEEVKTAGHVVVPPGVYDDWGLCVIKHPCFVVAHGVTFRGATTCFSIIENNVTIEGASFVGCVMPIRVAAPNASVVLCGFDRCGSINGSVVRLDVNATDTRILDCTFRSTSFGQCIRAVTTKLKGFNNPVRGVIAGCSFKDILKTAPNGGECIMLGYGYPDVERNYGFVVSENTFTNCHGDCEIVSLKSNRNIVRENTFENCSGGICIRMGDRNTILDNTIKVANHGVRVAGYGNVIEGNTIEVPDQYFGVALHKGTRDLVGNIQYFPASETELEYNHLEGCARPLGKVTVGTEVFSDVGDTWVMVDGVPIKHVWSKE